MQDNIWIQTRVHVQESNKTFLDE